MLLRSSSSPVLESLLLAPLQVSCHTDPSPDIIKHENLPPEAVLPKCLSFTPRPITSCPITHAACPSFGSLRRVLSENDLSILAAPRSSSSPAPALFAANSLLHDDNAQVCPSSDLDLAKSRSHHPHVRKGRMPLALSRWRSLGSLASTEPLSVVFDSDSAILEEGDLASPNSSAKVDEEEERERSIFDKLALPVRDTSSVKAERASNTPDVQFKLNMVDDSCSSRSTSDNTYIHRVGGEDSEAGLEMNLSKHGADAAFSGSQEPSYVGDQGTSCLFEGFTGTTLLVPQEHGQASQPKYVYRGDVREMALGAGAGGGRGLRPPTSAGGGGGGGEAGGRGGRNSDPTELHYQSMLKNNPSHPLILQNYAQYLAEVKRDYQRAEEFFQRAILVNPSDGELLGQYAKLLWEVHQDRERAATYFERAVQAAPDNSYVIAAYASFLWSAEQEEEQQQETVEEVKGSSPANVPSSIFSLVSAGLL